MPHPERTYRMYFFVPYNLSPIQQAIQAGHAALEYASKYADQQSFKDFVFWDKTWIVLNGGTSNSGYLGHPLGTMEELYEFLRYNAIPCANFNEPDINNAMTAICFLADERVWDYENYPHFNEWLITVKNQVTTTMSEDLLINIYPDLYKEWVEFIGGEKNVLIRTLIKGKKLA